MNRSLRDLLGALDSFDGNVPDVQIVGVTSDSRVVEPGFIFVAIRGVTTDGHQFIESALGKGAAAIVSQKPGGDDKALHIVVQDSAKALARLAARFYGEPGKDLRMFGVTGTNGKTSTAHLLRSIIEKGKWGKVGIIGTLGHGVAGGLVASVHTTPEPLTLHRLLSEMRDQKCIGVVMEVSSHAVRQQRIWGLDYEIGMLTNVTRDHLDYHSSFEDYIAAKREFCYSLVAETREKENGALVYSRDNDISRDIGESFPGQKVSTSIEGRADVFATDVDASLAGTRFVLHLGDAAGVDVHLKLLGSFSAANAVVAAAAANHMGISPAEIKAGLESVAGVPGRFEALGGDGKPVVIVDYSHTPDSLERTLRFCRGLSPNRLISVFGCGGDRDKGKRPMMGRIAEANSDIRIVTSDNPRTEDPEQIIEDILGGMDRDSSETHVEPDRRAAIRLSIGTAGEDDLVAVCGKGHEDYQIIGEERHHFDDREEANEALVEWRKS
ncbi:MAG: UDP-N-acetylmuramoyl-L-alanyl-D-glutamate--2,6-diaminopimelate ligase [bacterium]|nr:UDP-N-acetylmuramoyl-L-alanyl-D-glutamate--2,6-diaminopimelate ligase [bacterium]